ncbi:hypothetical protein E4T56_gene5270 [Termitomyces sp. T112]|nr:hypothetical protein E4T56_gene5270 [Termitomyces sp. T112]KNZ71435.1 hypothetical protein J132_09889 [Termitomyces sp. J132]
MPSLVQNYDVLLEFTNDTLETITVQVLHDYGRNTRSIVLLHPEESVTLVLDAGTSYRYAVKQRTKVANVTARFWRDTRCQISHLFSDSSLLSQSTSPFSEGIRVDRHWRDHRFSVWDDA